MPSKTPHKNSSKKIDNGINGPKEVDKDGNSPNTLKSKAKSPKDIDESMTVVIPPAKSQKLAPSPSRNTDDDISMSEFKDSHDEDVNNDSKESDPTMKIITGLLTTKQIDSILTPNTNINHIQISRAIFHCSKEQLHHLILGLLFEL